MGFTATEGAVAAEGGKAAAEVGAGAMAADGAAAYGGELMLADSAAGWAAADGVGAGLAAGGAEAGAGMAAADVAAGAGAEAGGGAMAADAAAGAGAGGGAFESGFTASGVVPGAAQMGAGVSLADVVGAVKTAAPIVSAATQLMSAGAALSAAKAKAAAPGAATVSMPSVPQASTSADISSIMNKNSLLFGADSPSSTDLTGGNAGTANLGRVTLLGGNSKLGA